MERLRKGKPMNKALNYAVCVLTSKKTKILAIRIAKVVLEQMERDVRGWINVKGFDKYL